MNCYNSRIRVDIDMKLRPVIKLDKTNKKTLKKIDDDAMSTNFDVIVILITFIFISLHFHYNNHCLVHIEISP